MGIDGFYTWIKKNYSESICPASSFNKFNHIYIDTNFLLHNSLYKSSSRIDLMDNLYSYLNSIINNFIAIQSITFAIDGPAPYSKIKKQRERRFGESYNGHLSPLELTPGTDLMEDIDKEMKQYIIDVKNKYKFLSPKIELISSNIADEGELKILQKILLNSNNPLHSHLIVGNDADHVVMAMACAPVHNIFILIKDKTSRNIVSIDKFMVLQHSKYCSNQILMNNIHCLKNHPFRYDFVLLSIMMGNDYFPKLYYTTFDNLWNTYKQVYCRYNGTIINNKGLFNIHILKHFFTYLLLNIKKQFTSFDIIQYSEKDILSYLQGLLWCLNMYKTGQCSMYDYVYDGQPPKPVYILHFLNNYPNINIKLPTSDVLPVNANIYSLLLMPITAIDLVPKKYHKYINGKLKYIFESEICKKCITFRKKINSIKNKIKNVKNRNILKLRLNDTKHLYYDHKSIHHVFNKNDIDYIVKLTQN